MRLPFFAGGSYTPRSIAAEMEQSINVYAETIESGNGLSGASAYLIGTPGLLSFATLLAPGQAVIEILGRCFAASGGNAYELYADGTFLTIGSLDHYLGPVEIITNGFQVMYCCGAKGWTVNLSGPPVLTEITDDGFAGAGTGTYQDSYGIVSVPNTHQFRISANNNLTLWNGLDFGSKEGAPDLLQAVKSTQRLLWLIGKKTSEPWFNAGNANFPFQPVAGNLRECGTPAPQSPAVVDGELMWLAGDDRGEGYVVSIQNLYPVRISTFAVERAIQGYIKTYGSVSDAIGETYQEDGHTWYMLHFPAANATWAFDNKSRLWHERGFWVPRIGRYQATLGRFHAYVFEKHLVLGPTGHVYDQSLNYYDDDGADIRRLRRFPHISNENMTIRHARLQIDLQRGTVPQGVNPVLVLRYSDNGGKTWSNEKYAPIGEVGNYRYPRAIFRMLGSARDRGYEITFTGRVPVAWINAYLNDVAGTEVSG